MVKAGGTAGSCKMTMPEINWDDEEHRRCITARLVRRTYDLQSDQTRGELQSDLQSIPKKLGRQEALVVPERLHSFNLVRELRECRIITYGAIFEYVPPKGVRRHDSAPRFIVAFRGTVLAIDDPTVLRDLRLDVDVMVNRQHERFRFTDARRRVRELLENTSAGEVWLAGHSLGASIALDVGRDMAAMECCYLPTFLFNPPQVSLAPVLRALRMAERAKRDVCATVYVAKAMIAKTVGRSHEASMAELFDRLAPWVPELFVHERDPICQGFMDYFELRQTMLEWSSIFRPVAEIAMRVSFRDMCVALHLHSTDDDDDDAEDGGREEPRVQPHLLPSARLWKNSGEGYAHGLDQWCLPDTELNLRSTQYFYGAP